MNGKAAVDALYESLFAEASNPRQRASLERLKQASDYLESNGLKVSPSSIERYCVDRGWDGPKAQSIRNSKDVLLRYVRLRQAGQHVVGGKPKADAEPAIADETLRAYVQLLKEERDQAVATKRRIEAGLRRLPGIPVDDLIRSGLGGAAAQPPEGQGATVPTVDRKVLNVLRRLFEPTHLADCGLELYKERIRVILTRNVLLERDEVQVLRSLLAVSSDDDSPSRATRSGPGDRT
ncbi:hypothetical protein [Ralstonia pseudosolanacearum]|uniref:hypothetical protein n=1 Tax=Ralstonia pseudosolanacearum TaxID=1310165 RepID=UPI001675288E|nr:hypothetical protein [Ralstonia pseudosolanacearum]